MYHISLQHFYKAKCLWHGRNLTDFTVAALAQYPGLGLEIFSLPGNLAILVVRFGNAATAFCVQFAHCSCMAPEAASGSFAWKTLGEAILCMIGLVWLYKALALSH
jgi:uncharacterized YccA/Bax inhibitor family protein